MELVPKNAFRAVSTFSKRPPPAPVAKLISEKHVGSDGNFTIHMGFVLAGVLSDRCVYLSLDDFHKGHIPLTSTTVGDESLYVVPQSVPEHVRQTQTQPATHPPSTNGVGQPWKNTNDTTCTTADFPQSSFLELAAATANITEDQTGGTGIFTSPATAINPPSSLTTPHQQQHPTQYDLAYGQSFGTTTTTSTANGNPLFLQHHTTPQNQQQSMIAYQHPTPPPPQPQREFTAQTLPVKPKPPRKHPEAAVKKPRKTPVKDAKRKKRVKDSDSD